MQVDTELFRKMLSRDLMDVMIRVGLVAFLVIMAVQIFAPFMGLMLWALILAVTLYPLHLAIAGRLGDRQGLAVTLLVVFGLFLIGVPIAMLGSSSAAYLGDLHTAFENGSFAIQKPDPAVAGWPIVGDRLYALWNQAAQDLPGLLEKLRPQLAEISKFLLGLMAGTAGGTIPGSTDPNAAPIAERGACTAMGTMSVTRPPVPAWPGRWARCSYPAFIAGSAAAPARGCRPVCRPGATIGGSANRPRWNG